MFILGSRIPVFSNRAWLTWKRTDTPFILYSLPSPHHPTSGSLSRLWKAAQGNWTDFFPAWGPGCYMNFKQQTCIMPLVLYAALLQMISILEHPVCNHWNIFKGRQQLGRVPDSTSRLCVCVCVCVCVCIWCESVSVGRLCLYVRECVFAQEKTIHKALSLQVLSSVVC